MILRKIMKTSSWMKSKEMKIEKKKNQFLEGQKMKKNEKRTFWFFIDRSKILTKLIQQKVGFKPVLNLAKTSSLFALSCAHLASDLDWVGSYVAEPEKTHHMGNEHCTAGTDPIKILQHKFYATQFFPGFWLVVNIKDPIRML